MASKRNENRQSTVKGYIVTLEPLTKEEFEIRTPYTRSIPIATKFANEILGANENNIITVTDVIPDELKKVIYDAQLVVDCMNADYEYEETAQDFCTEDETIVPYTMHEYQGQVWMYDEDTKEYHTNGIVEQSPLKFTKVDARAFIKMSAETYYNLKVIGIHDTEHTEIKRYAIVSNDKLHLCEKPQS